MPDHTLRSRDASSAGSGPDGGRSPLATTRLGKYHVLERIARGGMAEIYRAKTVGIAGFEKILALKRILPDYAREARFIRSFIDEARIAVTLNHRNIVQVFDFGKAEGELYLAMELIEGASLHSALDAAGRLEVPLPAAVACSILADVGAGLDYAHRKTDAEGRPLGIVHCDVSPHNVMLSFEGFVKILDFGVARARFANPPRERRLRGKPRYMAPEQTRGLVPSAATDVFALGILAWELLTGLPLFEGADLAEILAAVRRADPPAVAKLNPDVPGFLSDAIGKALSLEPAERGDAAELSIALARTSRELSALPGSRIISEWLVELMADDAPGSDASTAATARVRLSGPAGPGTGHRHRDGDADIDEPTAIDGAAAPDPPVAASTLVTDLGTSEEQALLDSQAGDAPVHEPTGGEPLTEASVTAPSEGEAEPGAGGARSSDSGWDWGRSPGARSAASLGENRRVVATAVRASGGEPDARRELLRLLSDLAYKHGAVVHKDSADGLVAVFGLEVAGEDDIASAMQFSLDAVEMSRETARADPLGVGPSVRIATRAGITAQRSGRSVRLRGDAVDEARLLAREADPSRPLLTGGTGRLASARFVFRELPARRHRSRRLRVLELVGPRDFEDRTRTLRQRRGRYIGRTAQLEALVGAYERALAGERRVVAAVLGAAGTGKSRLLAELVAQLGDRAHPPRFAALAASPVSQGSPFGLFGDLLQVALNLTPRRGQGARGHTIQRLRHVLGRAGLERSEIDECAAAIDLALELRDGALGSHGQGAAALRDRVASAVRSVRRTIPGPAVIVIDDLHLTDLPSAEALRQVVSAPDPGGPELVVATAREPLDIWLPDDTVIVRLDELDPADADELIRERLAEAASDEAVAAVAERAGGNPLFIEELASAVRELGRVEVPAGLRDVLMARVDRLTPASKATLQHAAVVGPVFRSRILEELLGPAVHQHLEELLSEGLVVRADFEGEAAHGEVDEGELGFRHTLLQEAVYESLAAAARRSTHARLGRLLAARLEAGREEPPRLVARHLELGGELGLAAALWLRAGRVALAAYDAPAARRGFSRVIELLDQSSGSASSDLARADMRWDALLGREQALRELGDHDAQELDLTALADLAAGDPAREAEVQNRQAIRLLRLGDYGSAAGAAEQAERAARAAGDQRALGEALRILGEAHERTGEFERGLEVARQAASIFRGLGLDHEEMQARIGIGRNHLTRARYEAAWATYEPILERLDETADPWLERIVRNHVAVIHLCLGELEKAMVSARRSMELCEFYGDEARAGDNLSVCGLILTEAGQYQEADECFRRALDIHERTHSRWSRSDCQVYAGTNLARMGRPDEALAMLSESITSARDIGAPYIEVNGEVALAGVLLDRDEPGDADQALAAAARGLDAARAATLVGAEIVALTRRAEALRRLGRVGEAEGSSMRAVAMLEEQRYLEGSEEEVWWVHHRVLDGLGETEAARALEERARRGVERKLGLLTNPAWRTTFVSDIALHREILGERAADPTAPA